MTLIAVDQYAQHPNYDALMRGFREVLEDWGKQHARVIKYDHQVADNNPTTARTIAVTQLQADPALLVALGTPAAQAVVSLKSKVPVVFGAITDPKTAGLVSSIEAPGGNATGSSDVGPYDQQFALIRRLLPTATTVGIIRNPGESQ